jgi:hypothetical protein
MTGQVRPEFTESPGPGFAKRPANFLETAARAGAFAPSAMRRLDIDRAAAQGTPSLSDAARSLLHFYLTHLSITDIESGETAIWPGAVAAMEALGIGEASLRRRKRELEAAGFIIRQYDRRNRPLDQAAIDLAPFLERVPAILEELAARLESRKRRFADAREADASTENAITTAQAIKDDRLKQSYFKESDTCTAIEDVRAGPTEPPPPTAAPAASDLQEDAKTIRMALDLSPKLSAALAPDGARVTPRLAGNRLNDALAELFPEGKARNIGHTFLWAARRFGAGAWLRLAIAIEDPAVKDPIRYFGWLATTDQTIDIAPNIERLRALHPPPLKLDAPADDLGRAAAEAIAGRIGAETFNAWFDRKATRFGVFRGDLLIETESAAALRKMRDLSADLNAAAGVLGFEGVTIRMAT